jgi:hypothetical protein
MNSIWEDAISWRSVRKQFWRNKPAWTINQFIFLLHGFEPRQLNKDAKVSESDAETRAWMMLQEASNWKEWSPGCPGISASESNPMEVQIEKIKLINWASSLEGIKLPTWITELIHTHEDQAGKTEMTSCKSQSLSTKERNTYLKIIAALCIEADLDLNKPHAAESNGVIDARLQELNLSVSENSIAKSLKAAHSLVKSQANI